ncbi:hypothetical protein AB0C27_41700 [Nonomuraea sp. NPDC048882]|uniref:hypothetical protein n=1 Tax=Nonomuraea sp. NPDC048882 TaxID=3154347 RepID=UPI0034001203
MSGPALTEFVLSAVVAVVAVLVGLALGWLGSSTAGPGRCGAHRPKRPAEVRSMPAPRPASVI